jgi:hypothetical protein
VDHRIVVSHDTPEAVIEPLRSETAKIAELRAYAAPADKAVKINKLLPLDYARRGYHLRSE